MVENLNVLLKALVDAHGVTVREKMEAIIVAGDIFTADHDALRIIAVSFDNALQVRSGWVTKAISDIEAANRSRRLAAINIYVSPFDVRKNMDDLWSEGHVAMQEVLYRRGKAMTQC